MILSLKGRSRFVHEHSAENMYMLEYGVVDQAGIETENAPNRSSLTI